MNNFTKVKVIGGIGNQLFVLVFGLAISNKLDTKLIVDDSIIHLGSNKSRKMEIANLIFNGFNIEYRRSKLKELLVWHFKFITFLNKIFWKFSKLNRNLIFEDSLLNELINIGVQLNRQKNGRIRSYETNLLQEKSTKGLKGIKGLK